MSTTLLLDRTTWDLTLDISGNLALASEPYSQAQDAASAIKTFQGEVWTDVRIGVPYFALILGHLPPLTLIKTLFVGAALTVPGVVAAQVFITALVGRQLSGQVQITTDDGQTSTASF